METAKTIALSGEIVDIKVEEAVRHENWNDSNATIFKIDTPNGPRVVWVSERAFDEFELMAILFVGNHVSIEVEEVLANKTGYIDANGDTQLHQLDRLTLVPATAAPTGTYKLFQYGADYAAHIKSLREGAAEQAKAEINRVRSMFRPSRKEDATTKVGLQEEIARLESKLAKVTDKGIKANMETRLKELNEKLAVAK